MSATPIVAVFPAMVRPLLEPRLPDGIDARWFVTPDDASALAPDAEIGWFDMYEKADMAAAVARAGKLRWLNSIYAGVDGMPLAQLARQGTAYTNGAGINAITIAEYVVMAMLTEAKGFAEVVRAGDRRAWLTHPPRRIELAGSSALIIGAGAIGGLVATRLAAFDVAVTSVRRSASAGASSAGAWRSRLGEFDWVILAVPATAETDGMIGAVELAAMKRSATLINIARGSVVDQDALVTALRDRTIAGAFLDVTTPEPLPADHPLWELATVTMHLSGQSQDKMVPRSVDRFLTNLTRWQAGEPLLHRVDLERGY